MADNGDARRVEWVKGRKLEKGQERGSWKV